MKEGEPCDLLEQLAAEPAFSMHTEDLAVLLKPEAYICLLYTSPSPRD